MTTVQITPISAGKTQPLRRLVLRPEQPPEASSYPLDYMAHTGHFGAWDGDKLIGIASVFREAPPGSSDERAWRIRGMAVDPMNQRQGIGARLLEACLMHVRGKDGRVLWCNARTSAALFYEKHGFYRTGIEFEIEGIGPHWLLHQTLEDIRRLRASVCDQ